MNEKYYDHSGLKYYEIANNLQPLVLIHAQGVDRSSYTNVAKQLSKKFHIIISLYVKNAFKMIFIT